MQGTQPIHLQTRREALPLYQLMKKSSDFTRTEEAQVTFDDLNKATINSASSRSAKGKRTTLIIYCSHEPGRQCSHSGGKRGGREVTEGSKACVLHLRGPHTIQTAVSSLPKVGNGNSLGIAKASALLSRSLGHSSVRSSS